MYLMLYVKMKSYPFRSTGHLKSRFKITIEEMYSFQKNSFFYLRRNVVYLSDSNLLCIYKCRRRGHSYNPGAFFLCPDSIKTRLHLSILRKIEIATYKFEMYSV